MGRWTREREERITNAEDDIALAIEILQAVRILARRARQREDLAELERILAAARRLRSRALARRNNGTGHGGG